MRGRLRAIMAAAVLLVAACASRPPMLPALAPQATASVELVDTPFFAQTEYQCGPAALATLLNAAGVAAQPEALADQVYVPAKQGSLQVELLAATRRAGRVPYVIEPTLGALIAELEAGRPVLVMQNLGLGLLPVWHYAVVIGVAPERDQLILRSGVERRQLSNTASFIRSWGLAENWAMVVLSPGDVPMQAQRDRYLSAVALAEPMLAPQARARAYRAALDRWPSSATAQFGLAHALYEAGQLDEAETAYRVIVGEYPRHAAAWNNLAQILWDRGCYAQARDLARRALAIATEDQPALVAPIRDTLRTLSAPPDSPRARGWCKPI